MACLNSFFKCGDGNNMAYEVHVEALSEILGKYCYFWRLV